MHPENDKPQIKLLSVEEFGQLTRQGRYECLKGLPAPASEGGHWGVGMSRRNKTEQLERYQEALAWYKKGHELVDDLLEAIEEEAAEEEPVGRKREIRRWFASLRKEHRKLLLKYLEKWDRARTRGKPSHLKAATRKLVARLKGTGFKPQETYVAVYG